MALTMAWCCCYLSFACRTLLSNLTCLYSSFPAVMWRPPLTYPTLTYRLGFDSMLKAHMNKYRREGRKNWTMSYTRPENTSSHL